MGHAIALRLSLAVKTRTRLSYKEERELAVLPEEIEIVGARAN